MSAVLEMLKRFFRNIRYIRKIDLRETIPFTYEEQLENFLYYIPNSSVLRPKVYTDDETVDFLVSSNTSLVRFGDGELSIIAGKRISFQKYDTTLARRMKEIIQSDDPRLSIAINRAYYYPVYNPKANSFSNKFMIDGFPRHRKVQNGLIDFDRQYLDAAFTLPINDTGSKEEFENQYSKKMKQIQKLRTIWENKDVTVVTCKTLISNIKYNIFDNAKRISYIFTPPNMHSLSTIEYMTIL